MDIKYLDLQKITALYGDEIEEAVTRVVRSGWYLQGSETAAFEKEFARYQGACHCLGTSNGLDALTLILLALKQMRGWENGDEVIVSAHTFIATIEAISRAGLNPVLCDVAPDGYLMDVTRLPLLLSARTRAILPVHLYGKLCDMNRILQFADDHGLSVVEDAAQAHGARDEQGCKAGSRSDAAAFSFYPAKNLGALGDAGAIVSNNAELIERAQILANYGMRKKYVHEVKGLNCRIDELNCAVLRVKLQHLDADNALRRKMAHRYFEEVDNPHLVFPDFEGKADAGNAGYQVSESVYHVLPVMCRRRDALREYLNRNGVATNCHYPCPPHLQKAYPELSHLSLPETERICREELSLPLNPALTDREQEYIITLLNQFSC